MATNSAYCKACTASSFRAFSEWTEKTTNLRKGKKIVDEKEVLFNRNRIEDTDILYLHSSYIVTDGIFNDEHIVFDNVTDEWKKFCHEVLKFSIPDYQNKGATAATT